MRLKILTLVAIVALVACGKSEQQKQAEKAAEELKKAAEAMSDAAAKQGAATGAAAADMAKAMQGMATALSTGADGKVVEPVAFQTLQTHLPKVSGWEMSEPKGERMTMPVPFSQIETRYKNGEQRIDAKIVDTGFAKLLLSPWGMMLASGYSRETSNGYEKATQVAGNPAIEKWNSKSQRGEIDVLVGNRYMVTLESREMSDIKQLQSFASNFDFNALAAAK